MTKHQQGTELSGEAPSEFAAGEQSIPRGYRIAEVRRYSFDSRTLLEQMTGSVGTERFFPSQMRRSGLFAHG